MILLKIHLRMNGLKNIIKNVTQKSLKKNITNYKKEFILDQQNTHFRDFW